MNTRGSGGRQEPRYTLWIDGVGAYVLFLNSRVSIGGPAAVEGRFHKMLPNGTPDSAKPEDAAADVALLANLSRQHAAVVRSGDGYVLQAHSWVKVAGRLVDERTDLNDANEIEMGTAKLRFRMPNPLSHSARLEFVSDHRPVPSVDGVVLMSETCLLGPGSENHVPCPQWPGTVILIRDRDGLRCKSRLDLFAGQRSVSDNVVLQPGDVVSGPDLRFRVEAAASGRTNR